MTKDQNSVDDAGYSSSYLSSIISGKIISIYNKYIDDDSSVLMTTVDGIGAQKTDVLFNENEKVVIIPKSAKQIDEDTILMIKGLAEPFHHTDRNTLVKIADATPNPLARKSR